MSHAIRKVAHHLHLVEHVIHHGHILHDVLATVAHLHFLFH